MAFPYSHVTRSNGTILTASIYNTDHQKHIDHNIPEDIDDFSVTATEMKITADPGEVGTESLATSLSEELARLRFIIKEITGKTEWYETPASNLASAALGLFSTFTNKTGGTLVAGDVVAIDTANDTAVALVDTLASTRRFVVALESILNNAAGKFSVIGVTSALMQGAVTRGNWVYKSATTKALADTGVASTAAAPTGAVGIATVTGSNGVVSAIILLGPSTSASLGLANNSAVVARNVGNSAVVELLKLDGSDRTTLGPGGTANVVIAGQARHDINANDRFVLPVGADKWAV